MHAPSHVLLGFFGTVGEADFVVGDPLLHVAEFHPNCLQLVCQLLELLIRQRFLPEQDQLPRRTELVVGVGSHQVAGGDLLCQIEHCPLAVGLQTFEEVDLRVGGLWVVSAVEEARDEGRLESVVVAEVVGFRRSDELQLESARVGVRDVPE